VRRPTDWAPLAGADPIPGDPDEIQAEAARLARIADTMQDQIASLRRIGKADTLTGEYADKLRTESDELAGRLEKAVGRYRAVGGHLGGWAGELRTAQEDSLKALDKAKTADHTITAGTAFVVPPGPDGPTDPEQAAIDRRRDAAVSGATEQLRAARSQLDAAVEHARRKGSEFAGRIRDAVDDDVKDSWWDNRKDWVDRNAGWISAATDILSYVATGLAVLSLFIPGVNIIALLAIGLTAVVLVGHTTLAASGNGSWFDVGLDVFALATFGLGRVVTAEAKTVQASTREAAAVAAHRAARKEALQQTVAAREAAGRALSRRTAGAAQKSAARATIDAAKRDASRAAAKAAEEVRRAPLAQVNRREAALFGGDPEPAAHLKDARALRDRFPGSPKVQEAARDADRLHAWGRGTWAAGAAADGGDKIGSNLPGDRYSRVKQHFTLEVGSTW
jgi:hypothetical protein